MKKTTKNEKKSEKSLTHFYIDFRSAFNVFHVLWVENDTRAFKNALFRSLMAHNTSEPRCFLKKFSPMDTTYKIHIKSTGFCQLKKKEEEEEKVGTTKATSILFPRRVLTSIPEKYSTTCE